MYHHVPQPAELLRQLRTLNLKARRRVTGSLAGSYRSAFRGSGLEFEEVRHYQYGDDVRSIDWNVTARMGTLYVKLYREERELNVYLLADVSGSMLYGTAAGSKYRALAEITAVLAWSALKNNDRFGLLAWDSQLAAHLPPKKGKGQLMNILKTLLQHRPHQYGTQLPGGLDYLRRRLTRKALVFVLSDFLDGPGMEPALAQLMQRHEVVLLHLHHPEEATGAQAGIVPATDLETGATVWQGPPWLGTSASSQAIAATGPQLAALARKRQASVLHLDVTRDYLAQLEAFFQTRSARPNA